MEKHLLKQAERGTIVGPNDIADGNEGFCGIKAYFGISKRGSTDGDRQTDVYLQGCGKL